MSAKVTIVLVNYNGFEDTKDCLCSLQNLNYSDWDVVVVDNCSSEIPSPETLEYIKTNATLIRLEENLGFSGGNNVGIRYAIEAKADYILLLNNDTTVESDFLRILVDAAEKNTDVGIVSGKIKFYSRPQYIWFGGGYFDFSDGTIGHERYNELDIEQGNIVRDITFATGCLMLIPVDVIRMVGFMEEKYFLYSEDTDYCCRVLRNNLRILFCEKAVIYHKVSASTGKNSNLSSYYTVRNKLYIIRSYVDNKTKAYTKMLLSIVKDVLKKRKNIKPVLKAVVDFINSETGMKKINL